MTIVGVWFRTRVRVLSAYIALGLGTLLVLIGVVSIYVGDPHPEFVTAGIGLLLATGLLGKPNGNGRR